MSGKKVQFKSEISQLMDILVHSLYKEREIFLRELISNAVDALNKFKIKALTENEVKDKDLELKIEIDSDKDKKMIIIRDSGIGMNEKEVMENIGTIAYSGSKAFLEKIEDEDLKKDLIGQFGVGFYSVFMVAERVTVTTRSYRPDDLTVKWVSDGKTSYTIETLEDTSFRGTEIKIEMRDDSLEFTDETRIKSIIDRYSKFVPFPIFVKKDEIEKVEPIWLSQPSQVDEKKYKDFYKYISHSGGEPLTYFHINSDAPVDLKAVMYVPSFSMLKFGIEENAGVKLYCRKVLIEEKAEDIIPSYLKFLKGVVDSEEIDLNVSRESIQNNQVIRKIKSSLSGMIIKRLKDFQKKDRENYLKFFEEFGAYLKDGIIREAEDKEKVAELLMFEVSGEDQKITLNDYLEKSEDKKTIYYMIAKDKEAATKSPHLEYYTEKKIPVVLFTETIDEFVSEHLTRFKDAEFKLISKEDVVESDETAESSEENKDFINKVKNILKDRVEEVRFSTKLVSSPYCVVSSRHGLSSSMEHLMKMTNKDYVFSKKILELNPDHDMIKSLETFVLKEDQKDMAELVLNQILDNALLMDNQPVDPADMVKRVDTLLDKVVTKR